MIILQQIENQDFHLQKLFVFSNNIAWNIVIILSRLINWNVVAIPQSAICLSSSPSGQTNSKLLNSPGNLKVKELLSVGTYKEK